MVSAVATLQKQQLYKYSEAEDLDNPLKQQDYYHSLVKVSAPHAKYIKI